MKATTKWQKKSETIHVVYGVSIIILAFVVGLLSYSVITGKEFPLGFAPMETPSVVKSNP